MYKFYSLRFKWYYIELVYVIYVLLFNKKKIIKEYSI